VGRHGLTEEDFDLAESQGRNRDDGGYVRGGGHRSFGVCLALNRSEGVTDRLTRPEKGEIRLGSVLGCLNSGSTRDGAAVVGRETGWTAKHVAGSAPAMPLLPSFASQMCGPRVLNLILQASDTILMYVDVHVFDSDSHTM
jgi:hypothetical protein